MLFDFFSFWRLQIRQGCLCWKALNSFFAFREFLLSISLVMKLRKAERWCQKCDEKKKFLWSNNFMKKWSRKVSMPRARCKVQQTFNVPANAMSMGSSWLCHGKKNIGPFAVNKFHLKTKYDNSFFLLKHFIVRFVSLVFLHVLNLIIKVFKCHVSLSNQR